MSTKNIWKLFNKLDVIKNSDSSTNLNKQKKRRIINSKQKLTSIQYKSISVANRQQVFLKYLSPINNSTIPLKFNQKMILTSIEYSNQFINNLDPVLWIDTSDLTSLLRNSNNNVYQILDKSGNNNHLYQSVKANQPKYHNGGLLFNSNQYMIGNYTFTQSINNMSIFIVMKQYNQTNQSGGIISGYSLNSGSDITDDNAWAFHSSNSSTYRYRFISNSDTNPNNYMINSNNVNTTMSYGIYEIIINNGTGYLYYNGALINSASLVNLGNFTNLVLGARYNSPSQINTFYSGEIYEVMILNSALSAGDRYKVERYLLDKWSTSQISRTIPISNIYTWLDASSINNFTLDINNNVLSWKDKNNTLNFTQSNSSFYPVFDTNKVIFDGSYLTMTDTTGLNLNNFSIFYVFEELTHTNNAGLLSCINTTNQNDNQITNGFALTTPLSNTIRLQINSQMLSYTDSSLSKKLYEFNINNGTGTLYINGVQRGTTAFGSLGTGKKFAIGARQTNGIIDISNLLNINLYELIILNTSASYAVRSQIYSYLNEKWNIPCILSSPASNQKVWLDSNNSSSITVNSGNITGWNDISSNNYPVTINNTPPVQTTVNSLKYATFNGSDLNINFQNNGGVISGANFTLYIVFSANTMTTANCRLISFNNGTNDTSANTLNINSVDNNDFIQTNNLNFSFNETLNFDNNLNILSISCNNNVWSIFINNYLIKTLGTGTNYSFNTLDIGNILGGTLPWTGYINEVIFYNTLLDTNSSLGTINYLSNKWSIPISSSPINEYIIRNQNTDLYYVPLNYIFQNQTNIISVSDTVDKSGPLNLDIELPITSTKPNQLSITTTDLLYLSIIDKNIIYNVTPFVNNTTIVLPSLDYDGDYFAFINNSIYDISITGPDLNYTLNAETTSPIYFTYSSDTYTSSENFNGFVCTLNKYNNTSSDNFIVYIGGWSNTLSYIKKLYIYDDNNNYIATTNNIYFKNTYQADFTINLSSGTYTFVVSDIKSNVGNMIGSTIDTSVQIGAPTATLDHYINGSSTYTITFNEWSSIYIPITTIDVWVSTNSNYSNSTYLVTTNTIVENEGVYSTTFTNAFSNGFYWLTLINSITTVPLSIQIATPVVIINNLSASLDNTTHTNPYNVILTNWLNTYTAYVPNLYIYGYLNSDFSDTPSLIISKSTSEIIYQNSVYKLPFNYTFDIGRNYYLSISDTSELNGFFNVHLSNSISKLIITGSINPIFGYCNASNVFTITLSNNETYNLREYLITWYIYHADNIFGIDPILITSTTLNNNQTLNFSYNPLTDSDTQYFYVANSDNYTGRPYWLPTNITGCQLWLDASQDNNFTFNNNYTINTWLDRSGNNNVATCTGTCNYSKNSVMFNGSVYFTTPYTSSATTETCFIIMTFNNISNPFIIDSTVSNGREYCVLNGISKLNSRSNTTYASGTNTLSTSTTYLLEYSYNSSTINLYYDGTLDSTTSGSFSFTGNGNTKIGANQTTGLNGTINEILIYNSVLTTTQRQVVEGYLAWKWNINSNLPDDHPFFNAAPTANVPLSLNNLNLLLVSPNIELNITKPIVQFKSINTSMNIPKTITVKDRILNNLNKEKRV